jgi:hypothetical protein
MRVTVDKLKDVLKAIDSLDVNRVLVGVPEEKSARSGVINNATLARIHEYGSPAAHIPPRPFLEPGIMRAVGKIANDLREGAREALDEMKPGAADKALNKAGMHTVQSVQEVFTDNDWEPLKHPRPKKGRSHRKGADVKENPLIDTGALRRSISYVVREKGV